MNVAMISKTTDRTDSRLLGDKQRAHRYVVSPSKKKSRQNFGAEGALEHLCASRFLRGGLEQVARRFSWLFRYDSAGEGVLQLKCAKRRRFFLFTTEDL